MNVCGKQGEVYLQHQKHGEKWKRYWLALYPASPRGVARLELSEAGHERSTVVRRHPERKVVRLSDCVSVVKLPPHAEAYPRDNMGAFYVETDDKRLVFAAEKQNCREWVEKICNIAFQKHSNTSTQNIPQMEDNQIYMSREELSTFKVLLLPTEASVRCGLEGQYWLLADREVLVLQDLETRKTVMEWPYEWLRRYGRDKMLFSIEAGRRCDSGPGAFNFETRQSDEIHRFIEEAIRQQKSLTVTRGKQSPLSPRSRSPRSPLPKRPQSYTESSPDPSETSKIVHSKSAETLEPVDCLSSSKSRHSDPGGGTCLIEPVYMDPVTLIGKPELVYAQPEVLQSNPNIKKDEHILYSEPVYSDPADVIRSGPNPTNIVPCQAGITTSDNDKRPEAVYAEVYDHIQLNLDFKTNQTIEEPIYSVPEVVMNQSKNSQPNKIPDEITAIYSTVNKPPKTPQKSQEKNPCQTSEIVCEDLGMI